jgi:hypothetical protein
LVCAAAVLVMDDTGSVGLDLSFAGAVFLMEPLADAALEQQVVSRAHRMGADPKRPILVETLVMKVWCFCDAVRELSSRICALVVILGAS